MKKILTLFLLALSISLAASPSHAQRRGKQAAQDGGMLAQSCNGCHGENGFSLSGPMPIIGGQNEVYLAATLKAYRDGTRPGTVMPLLVKAYTDAQIGGIASWYSKFSWAGASQPIDPALVAKGKPLFTKVCADCHPNGGRESKEGDYPLLAGQWLKFMHLATQDAKSGARKVDDKFLAKLEQLKADELDAVLAYLAAQK